MDPTARAYGLRIDAYVDERRDPVKATDAALDYLSDLYQQYGSWYLAAAAYNAGPTRVSLAVARHSDGRAGDESLYWEIVDHLPKETAQYVPKLLAATYLARYAARFDLDVTLADPYVYDLLWAPGAHRWQTSGRRWGCPTIECGSSIRSSSAASHRPVSATGVSAWPPPPKAGFQWAALRMPRSQLLPGDGRSGCLPDRPESSGVALTTTRSAAEGPAVLLEEPSRG